MNPNLIKIETTPDLVEQVYASLLDAISDGTLPPGARIMQEDIAEQLAVSRQPVLQALRLLRKDGFVLDAPGRGVLVAPLDVTTLVQIYQVRSTLDALAAFSRYVAELKGVSADPADGLPYAFELASATDAAKSALIDAPDPCVMHPYSRESLSTWVAL
jgi:DNA-binding transcriptional MocR family regulator